jgi:ferredoxin--NADP+ reductase
LESAAAAKFDEQSCLMMCGNPDMLDDLQAQLGERGLKKHRRKEPGQIVV